MCIRDSSKGDSICEIEGDKALIEIPSEFSGVLHQIITPVGLEVMSYDVIGKMVVD
ncbi:hypothetical protein HZI65_07060 [Haemophilus haemolyticus]|uniref:Lipoyl-binding domain-containing protein n=1 Tax=Haemophilus haemolyticus TaxID=726 RepID=A0A502JEM5_HAEHA|nr:hypothetical protein [Haemophilus haemolyticus]TPG97757.1 hypothetical protein EUX55_07115 [Haemophilus haemolyticus]